MMDVEKNSGSPKITSHEETQETFSEKGDKLRLSKKEILGEMKMQLLIAVPLVMLNLSFGGMQIVGMSFVGHLGNLALSGASIAKFFCYHGWFHFDRANMEKGSNLDCFGAVLNEVAVWSRFEVDTDLVLPKTKELTYINFLEAIKSESALS